jgi:transposase-like protein
MNEPNREAASVAEVPAQTLRTLTASQKAEWAEKYLQSGLGLREFSSQHGLGYMSLYRWVRKRRGGSKPQEKQAQEAISFAELKLPGSAQRSAWAVELTLPNGTVLRMSKDTPPTLVDQLLRLC